MQPKYDEFHREGGLSTQQLVWLAARSSASGRKCHSFFVQGLLIWCFVHFTSQRSDCRLQQCYIAVHICKVLVKVRFNTLPVENDSWDKRWMDGWYLSRKWNQFNRGRALNLDVTWLSTLYVYRYFSRSFNWPSGIGADRKYLLTTKHIVKTVLWAVWLDQASIDGLHELTASARNLSWLYVESTCIFRFFPVHILHCLIYYLPF